MTRRVHMPRPGAASLTDLAALWCGAARTEFTPTTVFEHLASCRRCVAANRRHREDAEHRRTQARLQAERALDGAA